jgi:hypothetical protein
MCENGRAGLGADYSREAGWVGFWAEGQAGVGHFGRRRGAGEGEKRVPGAAKCAARRAGQKKKNRRWRRRRQGGVVIVLGAVQVLLKCWHLEKNGNK